MEKLENILMKLSRQINKGKFKKRFLKFENIFKIYCNT